MVSLETSSLFPSNAPSGSVSLIPTPNDGNDSPPSPNPRINTLDKIGYVLYVERLMGSDTIVWSGDQFFRLSDTPKAFKPLTLLLFSTSM